MKHRKYGIGLGSRVAGAVLLAAAGAQAGQILNNIHVDLAFRYDNDSDDWEIVIHGNDGDPDIDPDEAVMIVNDQPYPSDGGLANRPAGSQWDFLGVDEGEEVWLVPQAYTPFLYVGWRSDGLFAEYYDDDPRLEFTAPFVKISLERVVYSGTGEGHFSTWRLSSGIPEPWIASSDGLTDEDAYYFSSGHSHSDMGFSDLGVYRLDLSASAFLDDDGGEPPAGTQPVTSPVQSFYFAVGTFAEWKATHYEPHELVDDDPNDGVPEVAHSGSDTDGDGVSLLLEYAFNLVPVESDARTLVPGSGTKGLPAGDLDESGGEPKLVIEYVRRRAEGAPRLTYRPQFSSSLDGVWTDAGEEDEVVSEIDDTWERVRVTDPAGSGESSARFGRVMVELE